MSIWDQCCKSGKFNASFANIPRTSETIRKIEKSEEIKAPAFLGTSEIVHISNTAVKNATTVETQFSFSDLRLNGSLLKWIESLGFSLPNKVQNELLYPLCKEKSNHIIIRSPKKSGKTSAALLFVLNKLLLCDKKEYPKALFICPTFELADSTFRFVEKISNYCEIKIFLAVKGKKLNKGEHMTADLVISTPDKALELSKLTFNLKKAKYLVLDDAHYLSDTVGHLKTVSNIFSQLSTKCCTILCTLFCNDVLDNFIDKFLFHNQRIEIENVLIHTSVLPKKIFIIHYNNEERVKALIHLEKNTYKGQTVVFCKTKDQSNHLKRALDGENISFEICNGDLKTAKRNNIIQLFKESKIKLLVTTYKHMEVLEAENIHKLIIYEQVLNCEHKLDHDYYEQIENLLKGRKNCLIGSFIEQKWEDSLIKPNPGFASKQVYENAIRIYANDLISGQNHI